LEFVDTTSTGDFRLAVDPTVPKRIGSLEGTGKPSRSYAKPLTLGFVQAQVTVTGEVVHPNGFFVLQNGRGTTLTQLLALANGVNKNAGDFAQITRSVKSNPVAKNQTFTVNFRRILRGEIPDVPLNAGDEVFIPPRQLISTSATPSPILMDTKPVRRLEGK
jgi:hypothetical protein